MPKILVADDSIAVRKVAERLLIEAGLGVALAANGEEAIAYLAKDRADVIVSDVIMPDKSGYEVCAFVRNNSLLAATPVLLISGIVNDEVTKQAESCRADGVLKKPFQGTSLKDKVLELLAKQQSQSAAPAPKPASATSQAGASAPLAGLKPASITPASPAPSLGPMPLQRGKLEPDRHPVSTGGVDPHLSNKLKELEGQLRAEQTRTESLVKRITDLEAEASRAKEAEVLLEVERQRVGELESKVAAGELQLSRIPQLEASLREEQESAANARREAAAMKNSVESIAQLEATLETEQMAATQLVQQISELEEKAARGKDAEAMLAREVERIAELQQKAIETEAELLEARTRASQFEEELAAERRKAEEHDRRVQESDELSTKVQELEALLATERDRNAVLVKRVSETEQVAVNATKRFEDMARKLGEIANLASQLGKGTGEF
jgi:CheY-like chemotaxis protein